MTPLARGWYWLLDYLYVGFWQVHGSLFRADANKYLVGERAPVVLLPGIYETWQFMRPVADLLHERGHPVHVVTELGWNRRTVVDSAQIVAGLMTSRKLSNVIIIAHSKGGLIGKYLMMSPENANRINRMVAIASPFSGSSLARYTVLPSLRAFLPTDPMIQMLVQEQFVNARITSIFGIFDPHIPGGSSLPGATNIQLPVAGHFRIMGDPRLLDAVDRACAA
ncbi:MAG: alpha/beta hydrolase [Cryobacterium sp.]|jgi:pimeloyl-ACP methyl ester carboxylesterase|nr:alpha/beta hydrolase [Cryobacterium sp.]